MKRHTLALGFALTLTIALGGSASAASADILPDVHPDVAFALQAEPGGVVVDFYTVEWPGTGMRLEVPGLLRASVGSCATGYVCAYSLGGQGGTKLSWPTCGTKPITAISTVGSIANARSSGTLSAFQGATVRASAGASSYVNVPATYRPLITAVGC